MRRQLEQVTREGLAKLGATPAQLAYVCEPGISDQELARRAKETTDAVIATRLAGIGMNAQEVQQSMDTSGTPDEQEARRRAALGGLFARSLEQPDTMDAILEQALRDPAFVAELDAAAEAEVARRARRRRTLVMVVGAALAVAGFVGWKVLRRAPCAKLLGTDAELAAIFGPGTKAEKPFDSKYFCHVRVVSTTGATLADVNLGPRRDWSGLARDARSGSYARVEDVSLGEEALLAFPPASAKDEANKVDLMAEAMKARARGARDPIGTVLQNIKPSDPLLVARGSKSAVRVGIVGTPEQARAFASHLARRRDVLDDVSY